MTADELELKINDFRFLLQAREFVREGEIQLETSEEAQDFLIKHLLVESIAGTFYSKRKLMKAYRKVKKIVDNRKAISSESLPVVPPRKHADKVLQNVYYSLQGNVCRYEKTPP